jgi:hypothetical protein
MGKLHIHQTTIMEDLIQDLDRLYHSAVLHHLDNIIIHQVLTAYLLTSTHHRHNLVQLCLVVRRLHEDMSIHPHLALGSRVQVHIRDHMGQNCREGVALALLSMDTLRFPRGDHFLLHHPLEQDPLNLLHR